MADFPSFDLLSEVEDLTMYMDGKSGSKFSLIDVDENVELNTGIPSHGLMNDDAMLAVDSSNALLGDPLLNFFDQNELLEPQSASGSFLPETLMPVSLPADPSTHRSACDAESALHPSTTTEAVSPAHTSLIAGPEDADLGAPFSQLSPQLERQPAVISASPRDTTTTSSTPVRIVVKTTKQPPSKMVAPLTLQKPARSLVKIPKVESSTLVVRMQAIRSGGKLGPSVSTRSSPATVTPAASTSRQSVLVPPTVSASTRSETKVPGTEHPFRSLRVRHVSETSDSSLSSSTCGSNKRKAYELDPQPDPQMERCRINAINAKRNREMKKAHLADLERRVVDVIRERDQLAGENESLREAKQKLEQQVKHLSNILKNQSKLSALIGKLGPSSVILGDMSSAGSEDEITSSSGMCLHVDGEEATIEYCSYCAKKAGKKFKV